MSLSPQAIRKLSHVVGQDTVDELMRTFDEFGGPVVHLDGNEEIVGAKTFATSLGINGVDYDWPAENGEGVFCNDGQGHLSWESRPGSGTVTSVGLEAPPEFSVSGSPVTTSGDLVLEKTSQPANSVYAGPKSDEAGLPVFRRLVAADIPSLPIGQIDHLSTALDSKVSTKEVLDLRSAIDRMIGVVDQKAGHKDVSDMEDRINVILSQKAHVADMEELKDELANHLDHAKDHVAEQLEVHGLAAKELSTSIATDLESKLAEKAGLKSPVFVGTITTHDISVGDGSALIMGQDKGVKIGKTRGEKLAFYGAIPVQQPAGDIVSALANLGLVKDPSLSQEHVVGLSARLAAIEEKLGI